MSYTMPTFRELQEKLTKLQENENQSVEEAGGIGNELRRQVTGKVSGIDQVNRIAVSGLNDALMYFETLAELPRDPGEVKEISNQAIANIKTVLKTLRGIAR